jgi:hypothetical protein
MRFVRGFGEWEREVRDRWVGVLKWAKEIRPSWDNLGELREKGVALAGCLLLVSRPREGNEGSAVSSVVEHLPDTEGVTGSNPVSRTIFL